MLNHLGLYLCTFVNQYNYTRIISNIKMSSFSHLSTEESNFPQQKKKLKIGYKNEIILKCHNNTDLATCQG